MKVQDIMTKNVTCIRPDTTVTKAAEIMKDLDVGSLPVCSDKGLVGMITDRDIVVRNVCMDKNPGSETVENVMTYNVTMATPDMQAEDVARLMAKNRIRRIPVVERDQVVGMVALGDLASDMRFDMEASEALTEISIHGIKRN